MAEPQLNTTMGGAENILKPVELSDYPTVPVDGTVKGRLETINVHQKNQFVIYPAYGNYSVVCDFPVELLATVQQAINRNVTILGTLFFNPGKPFPDQVRVKSLEINPPDDELPDLQSLRGSWKNWRVGRTAVDFIRAIRDE